jgi:hypothetical protein
MSNYKRIASLKTADDFENYIETVGVKLQFDREIKHGTDSPLGQPYQLDGFKIGNRFCILPMEGWDGTEDGKPSELTIRRWRHFGESGAKLIWGRGDSRGPTTKRNSNRESSITTRSSIENSTSQPITPA